MQTYSYTYYTNRHDGKCAVAACSTRLAHGLVAYAGVSGRMSLGGCRQVCIDNVCAWYEIVVRNVYDACYGESIYSADRGGKTNHDSGCTMNRCGMDAIQFDDDRDRMFNQYSIYNIHYHNGLQHRENISCDFLVGTDGATFHEETSVAVHGFVPVYAKAGLAECVEMYNKNKGRMAYRRIVPGEGKENEYGKSSDTSVISAMCDNTCLLYVSSCGGYKCLYKKNDIKNRSKSIKNVT